MNTKSPNTNMPHTIGEYHIGEYHGTIEDILARHDEPEGKNYPSERERRIIDRRMIKPETIRIIMEKDTPKN